MAVPSFLIKNGSTDFLNKQKNLFDILDLAEKEKKSDSTYHEEYMEVDVQRSNKRKRKETKQFRGKESLFKEPMELPLRFRQRNYKVPDFQRNPHKWVKYSLGDVTQDDMSNAANTAAALSFLRSIKTQEKTQIIKMETDEPEQKPIPSISHQFNVPVKQEIKQSQEPVIDDDDRDSKKPVFKSSKLIMPEYVVGQVKKEKRFKRKVTGEKVKEIYLNHIHEYEDE